MEQKRIAIIGAGNVGMGLNNGLINFSSNYGPHNISIIRRDYFKEYEENKIYYDNFPQKKLSSYKSIFLAVKPVDAVELLSSMKGKINRESLIISAVSGLNIDIIGKMLGVNYDRIVKCTLNLGISCGTGMIAYSTTSNRASLEFEEIIGCTAKFIKRIPSKKIGGAVTSIGSDSAIVTQMILLYLENNPEENFHEFMSLLSEKSEFLKEFIRVKSYVSRAVLGDDSFVIPSLQSTILTLKKSCHSKADLEGYKKRVATHKGSTREFIDGFDSLEKVTEDFFLDGFGRMNKKVKSFRRTIVENYNGWVRKSNKPIDKLSDFIN
jgi:hypothetical protein